MKASAYLAALLCLAGCSEVGIAQLQAEEKCLSLFQSLSGMAIEQADSSDDQPAGNFRFVSTGHFVIDIKLPQHGQRRAMMLTCTGDFNARTLTSLQFDGQLRQPAPGQLWTF